MKSEMKRLAEEESDDLYALREKSSDVNDDPIMGEKIGRSGSGGGGFGGGAKGKKDEADNDGDGSTDSVWADIEMPLAAKEKLRIPKVLVPNVGPGLNSTPPSDKELFFGGQIEVPNLLADQPTQGIVPSSVSYTHLTLPTILLV